MEYMEDSFQGVFYLPCHLSVTYDFLKGIAGADPEGLRGRKVF